MDELRTAVAYVFRKKNAKQLREDEFILTVSMDLHWFSPNDAKKFIEIAIDNDVLKKDADFLLPCFDTNLCFVPISFTPTSAIWEFKKAKPVEPREKIEDLFSKMVKKLVEAKGATVQDIIAKINRAKEKFDVEIEVAVLLVASELGVKMDEFLPAVEAELISRFLKSR